MNFGKEGSFCRREQVPYPLVLFSPARLHGCRQPWTEEESGNKVSQGAVHRLVREAGSWVRSSWEEAGKSVVGCEGLRMHPSRAPSYSGPCFWHSSPKGMSCYASLLGLKMRDVQQIKSPFLNTAKLVRIQVRIWEGPPCPSMPRCNRPTRISKVPGGKGLQGSKQVSHTPLFHVSGTSIASKVKIFI